MTVTGMYLLSTQSYNLNLVTCASNRMDTLHIQINLLFVPN